MYSNINGINHKKKRIKYCNNCNTYGHNYSDCHHPIISYGIICFRRNLSGQIEYLIIRRRFSYSYMDFIRTLRPKHGILDDNYLTLLLTLMTPQEHEKLKSLSFDALWDDLWLINKQRHEREYKRCKTNYETLIKPRLNSMLSTHTAKFTDSEWGFPKGKRNKNESSIQCAFREFVEETGLSSNNLKLINHDEIIEDFKSINNKQYRHVYYLTEYTDDTNKTVSVDPNNLIQCSEVDDIQWCSLQKCQLLFRHYDIAKKNLIENVEETLKLKMNQ
jgi:8-oxo-dGTP pyrophosphatase MutT (NUDIX family)